MIASASSSAAYVPVRGSPYAWYVACVLSAGYFVSLLDRLVMGVAMVPLKQDLALSDAQLGVLHGLGFVILYSAATPLLGRLADTASRRLLIVAGILVWTGATIACGLADTFWSLFSARLVVGFGEAALLPAGMSLIMAYFAREQVGRATGVFLIGGNLGAVAALVGGAYLLSMFTASGGMRLLGTSFAPWQALFVAIAVPGILVAVLVLTIREPARTQPTAQKPRLKEVWLHIRASAAAYSLHTVYSTCALILANALAVWSTSIYVRSHALDVATAAYIAGIVGAIAGISGQSLGGIGVDWLRKKGIVGAPCVMVAICLLVAMPSTAVFILSSNLVLSVAGFALAYLSLQASGPPSYMGTQMLASEAHRGVLMGIFITLVTLGSFGIGPAFIGLTSDRMFSGVHSLGMALLAAVVSFSAIGMLAALAARRRFDSAAL